MKKTLYFEPPKNTTLREYITIENGKIRDAHIVQLASEVPPEILKNDPCLGKDLYMPLKNFNLPLTFKRVDKYIAKLYGKKYTHEIVVDVNADFNPDNGRLPPPNVIFSGILKGRKVFIKLNMWELITIDFHCFSWSESSPGVKISIVTIILSIAAIFVSIAAIFIK